MQVKFGHFFLACVYFLLYKLLFLVLQAHLLPGTCNLLACLYAFLLGDFHPGESHILS